jgi:hypothetical protein
VLAADRGWFAQQFLHPGPVERDVGELDVFVAANEIWQPGDLDGTLVRLGAQLTQEIIDGPDSAV